MNLFNKMYYRLLEKLHPIDETEFGTIIPIKDTDLSFKHEFEVNGIYFEFVMKYVKDLDAFRITFENKSKGTYKVTGDTKYSARKVISIVGGAIIGGLKQMKTDIGVLPKYIYFIGNTDEPSRISLYNRLVENNYVKNLLLQYNYIPTDEIHSKIAGHDRLNVDQKEKQKFGNAKIYCFKQKEHSDVNRSSN